jgi:dCTP deaminase
MLDWRSGHADVNGAEMGVLPDSWIREMATRYRIIEPFAESRVRQARVSYGTTSYGYDFRLADEFRIPNFTGHKSIDPKKIRRLSFVEFCGRSCLIPGNSFILGRSLEYFRIPRDTLVICQGKSTYARCGLIVNVTPFEPEWEGFATVSLVNTAPVPVKVYAGEGIAQVIFLRAERECSVSYADRKGKYQAPKSIQLPRV